MMESGKDYGVRVVTAFQQFSVGQVIFPTGLHRSDLIRRKMVEPVKAVSSVEDLKKKAAARREQ